MKKQTTGRNSALFETQVAEQTEDHADGRRLEIYPIEQDMVGCGERFRATFVGWMLLDAGL